MDFLGFTFTPQGLIDLYAGFVASGMAIGFLAVVLSLFTGRRA